MAHTKQAPNQNNIKAKGKDLVKLQDLPIIGKQPESEAEEKYLRELVEYEFYNLEEPGMRIKFPYGSKGRMHNFEFWHGAKYTVPRFIARHLESKGAPLWKWVPDGTGAMHKELIGKNPRFRMTPSFGK
jgi:hypothetical protein